MKKKFRKGDIVKCIDDDRKNRLLTIGKLYTVINGDISLFSGGHFIYLIADDGCRHSFYTTRFELDIKYVRREKLKRIGL